MTPVPPEAVEACMRASDCHRTTDRNGVPYCEAHWYGWLSDVDACPRAERVAAAVVAALDLPRLEREAAAKALHEAADRMPAYHDRNSPEWAITAACRWLRVRASALRERRES